MFVTDGGKEKIYGTIQFYPGAPGSETAGPLENYLMLVGTTSFSAFKVIIPPKGVTK